MNNMHDIMDDRVHALWRSIENGAAKGIRRYSHPKSGNSSFETLDDLHGTLFALTESITFKLSE